MTTKLKGRPPLDTEHRKRVQIMLRPSVIEIADKLAKADSRSRSRVIEVLLLREGGHRTLN